MSDVVPERFRYRAFLSYRSTDRKVAEWLHRKLETYRIPRRLAGKSGTHGLVPSRLAPIFRDRDDARSAEDLETVIAASLARSQHLIVLCTPAAAAPESWVGREVEIFRRSRPDGEIHAVVASGEPPACFPKPLQSTEGDGSLRAPLAADLRTPNLGGDGRKKGLIKLIAGLAGLDFDDLWQRERRRTMLRAAAGAGAAVVAMVLVAVIVFQSIDARRKATAADRAEADSALRLAMQKLSSDEATEGLALLARAIRLDRGSSELRTLLYGQMVARSWLVPVRAFAPQERIDDVTFSADGARVVLRIGTIIEMWDVASGKRIGRLETDFQFSSITVGSDGWTVLFSTGAYTNNQGLALWNPRVGRAMTLEDVRRLTGLPDCRNMQVFDVSATGEDLAIRCNGLSIVSLRTQPPMRTILSPVWDIRSSRFASGLPFIIVDDKTIFEYQHPGAAIIAHDVGEGGEKLDRANPYLGRVAVMSGLQVEVRDLKSWKSFGTKFNNESRPRSAILNATGDTLMTTAVDDRIRVWNVERGERLFDPLGLPQMRVADFSSDGARIFAASDGVARWWSSHDGEPLGAPILQPRMLTAHVDARGDIVTVATEARVWQLASTVPPLALGEKAEVVELSLDGKTSVVRDGEQRLAGFDTLSGKRLWTASAKASDSESSFVQFDPNLSRAAVTVEQTLSMVDAQTWRVLWTLRNGQTVLFSGDGNVVLTFAFDTVSEQHSMIPRSATTGRPLAPPIDETNRSFLGMSHDGFRLAYRSSERVIVWDVRSRRVVLIIPVTEDAQIDFSRDGRQLAVSSLGALQVWDIAARTKRIAKTKASEILVSAIFSPDGRYLAVVSKDGVALCDSKVLDCTNEMFTHPDVTRVEFSEDGRRILTAADRNLRLWDVQSMRPLSLLLPREFGTEVRFSSDGTSAFAVSDGELYRIPLPSIDDTDADRLAELGEALAGIRIDRLG
ncbi:MAG TPA: toll/interleukin-1 receptor domain-containing protein, partial [Thermoanaerobaculia bacterium]